MLRQVYFYFSATLMGIAPLLGMGLIGLSFYPSLPSPFGWVLIVALELVAIAFGVWVFNRVRRHGPIYLISHNVASPDLDHLEPTAESVTKRRRSSEYANLVRSGQHLCKGGSFKIYGDWFGLPHESRYTIKSALYNEREDLLTIIFDDQKKLEISSPRHIFDSPTFFKVMGASRVRLSWPEGTKTSRLCYSDDGKEIITEAEVVDYKPSFFVSGGEPALMLYS